VLALRVVILVAILVIVSSGHGDHPVRVYACMPLALTGCKRGAAHATGRA
jgi:hypothetical protein